MGFGARHFGRERGEMKLDVGRRGFGERAHEHPSVVDADRERPGAVCEPFPSHAQAPPRATHVVVDRDWLRDLEHYTRLQVVLQVFADARQIVHDGYAVRLQQGWAADTG